MRWLWVLALVGCKAPPEAPDDLNELTHYLFREWDNPDPAVMSAGASNLSAFFDGTDLEAKVPVVERSWELTPVTDADLADVPHPADRSPADTYGVGTARLSDFSVADHAAWQLQIDQLPAEPSAAEYERRIEIDDPSCFIDHSCDVLPTSNDIRRQNFLMSVAFVLVKRFRWVELEDGRLGMISRSWIEESAVGDAGKTTIWQTYNVETWLPDGDRTRRYQVLWSEADVAGASNDLQIATVKSSTNSHFGATDDAIEALQANQE